MATLKAATDAIINRAETAAASASPEDLVYLAKAIDAVGVTSAVNFINTTTTDQNQLIVTSAAEKISEIHTAGNSEVLRVQNTMGSAIGQLTTRGDLLFHNGTGAARIALGTAGKVLASNGSDPVWSTLDARAGSTVAKLPDVVTGGYSGSHFAYLMNNGQVKTVGSFNGGSLAHGNDSNAAYIPNNVVFDSTYDFTTDAAKQVFVASGWMGVVTTNGKVYFSGNNGYGQFGLGDTSNRYMLTRCTFFDSIGKTVDKIFGTADNSWNYQNVFFLTTDGLLYSAGYNGNGDLGDGTTVNRSTPVRVGALTNVVDFFCGNNGHGAFFAVVGANRDLYSWGYNGSGELGLGDATNRTTPVKTSLSGVTKVVHTGGGRYNGTNYNTYTGVTIALANGALYATGVNDYGQLGVGDGNNRSSWTPVAGGLGVAGTVADVKASATLPSVYARLNDGTLRTWGDNTAGGLGMGDTTGRNAPAIPTLPTGFGAVANVYCTGGAANGYAAAAIIVSSTGKVAVTGYGGYGQLGTGDSSNRSVFTLISTPFTVGANVIKDVVMATEGHGSQRAHILLNDGRVFATGYGGNYALGVDANANNAYTLHQVLF